MTKSPPSVSVIIPTYNHAHFLPQAVQSVFEQTFQDFEVIVIDDGSEDGTRDVVQGIVDSRFQYTYQENQGLAASRNAGLRAAKGEFIAFLDADDILLPGKLQVQTAWMRAHEKYGLVASGWNYIDRQGTRLGVSLPWLGVPELSLTSWLFNCPVVPNSVLVRKHWLDHVGGFDRAFRRVEDWDLWLRLAYAGCKMAWIKEIVCCYRVLPGQMTSNAAAQKRVSIQMMDKFFGQADLPPEIRSLKAEVYTCLYSTLAGREYGALQIDDAKESIAEAIKLTPDLTGSRKSELINKLLSWVDNPFVGDPIEYTRRVFGNLPEEANALSNRKRWALGEIGLRTFYNAYHSRDWTQVWRAGLTVALNAPFRMLNRGFWSILWQSLRKVELPL